MTDEFKSTLKKRKFKRRKVLTELEKRSRRKKPDIEDEIERDVSIDRAKLDWENAKQTRLFEKYNRKFVQLLRERIEAESVFNGKKAKMAADIRNDLKKFGLDKGTDAMINLALPNHPDFKKAEKEFLDVLMKYERVANTMYNIGGRGRILSNLGDLMKTGHYTPTSMSPEEWYDE